MVDGVPGIVTKSATTTVLVKDGETTVIGGLYKNARRANEYSVPFLSKIPVIGWFFKSKSRAEENEELLIFITPRILKKPRIIQLRIGELLISQGLITPDQLDIALKEGAQSRQDSY